MNKIIITPAEWDKTFPAELTSLLSMEDFTTLHILQLKAYTEGITKEEIDTLMIILENA
jgi:hypothetical protein